MAEVQVLFPGLQDEKARAVVRLCRPFRVEDPVEAAYLAAREAYVEALARRAGLDVARDSDLTGDAVYVWVTGDPVRVAEFLDRLARVGVGGLAVEYTEDEGGGGAVRGGAWESCRRGQAVGCRGVCACAGASRGNLGGESDA